MLYSFDVFDTILYRKVPRSVDIFRLMEQCPQMEVLLGAKTKHFAECRRKAEFWFRRTHQREIGIQDIYQIMVRKGYINEKQAQQLIQLEFQTECAQSFLNMSVVNELKHHLQNNNRVILISDMYWNAQSIRAWLSEKDCVFQGLTIYVSCDCNASKAKGTLFREVQRREQYAFDQWVHTGDHVYADCRVPKRMGIHVRPVGGAKCYVFEKAFGSYDLNFAQVYGVVSQARQAAQQPAGILGASVAGPMVYQYVNWVLSCAVEQKIDVLFFVLRDGYIPKMVADEIIKYKGLSIRTDFLFGSRVAWRFPEITIDKLRNLSVWEKSNWIFRDPAYAYVPFERLGFERQELDELFGQTFAQVPLHSFADFKELLDRALCNDEFCARLLEKTQAAGQALYSYLMQALDNGVSYAFVDTNSTGKTQQDLNRFLLERKAVDQPVRFFYHTYLADTAPDLKTQMVFMNAKQDDRRFPEALFRAPYNPCYGYKQWNGSMVPRFFESDYCAWYGAFDYDAYLQGVLEFTRLFERQALDLNSYVDFLMRVVNFDIHSQELVEQMARIPFNPDMNGQERRDFYPALHWRALLHPFTELIYFPKGSYYAAGGIWPAVYKILFFFVALKRKLKGAKNK